MSKPAEGFPEGFSVQRIGVSAAKAIADHSAPEIAAYMREHPEIAEALLTESYDKRFTPSSFITEEGNKIRVGWFTRQAQYECVQEFSSLADAAGHHQAISWVGLLV